ncbi:MAG: orotate phosphoribosyltransferase [Clostridiales bacterium]|jgi:orotate phosphoribosyltransferase|nr:orotate phosphoribosyltransferase [Clostridiales bacterium]
MQEYKQNFIEFVVKCGALRFGEFKLKSGRISPYFFNSGEFKTGAALSKLASFYASTVADNISTNPALYNDIVLFGPAYKGIPLVAITALKLSDEHGIDYPICYNRKEAKDHGEGGATIGASLTADQTIVAIEDVVTAGTAIGETKEVLAANGGAKLSAVVIAMDRCEVKTEGSSETALQEIARVQGVQIFPVITIFEAIEYLHNNEIDGVVYINDEIKQNIEDYLKKYGA